MEAFDAARRGRFDERHRAQRSPGERARWLAAVLIVTTIAGIADGLRAWPPASPTKALPPPLIRSQLLPLVDPPVVSRAAAASALSNRTVAWGSPSAPAIPEIPVAAVLGSAEAYLVADAAAHLPLDTTADVGGTAGSVLDSRSVAIATVVPAVARVVEDSDPPGHSSGFVELPAGGVTRAVIMARRGITTGLRVTSAALKAVF